MVCIFREVRNFMLRFRTFLLLVAASQSDEFIKDVLGLAMSFLVYILLGCGLYSFLFIRFHDLRHSHATLLFRAGIHPKVISERLGHASVAFTLDTYSHVVPELQEAAADRFDRLLSPGMGERENYGIMPVVYQAEDIAKMLRNGGRDGAKKGDFETEPHRTRTCNLLIKRHEPYLLSGTDYTHPVSDIRKYGRDLCFAFYLLLSSVIKFVGKMLAKILLFIESVNKRKSGNE